MTDARAWLDEVDARTNVATDGPWSRDRTYPLGHAGPYSISVRSPQVTVSDGLAKGDAEFIAAARTDLPTATAALRAVLDLLDQADGEDEWSLVHTADIRTAITTALEDA